LDFVLYCTLVRPYTAYYVISIRRFGSLPANVFFADIRLPSDSTSRWTPLLRLTLPTAERVVVFHHLVVAHAGRTTKMPVQASNLHRHFCCRKIYSAVSASISVTSALVNSKGCRVGLRVHCHRALCPHRGGRRGAFSPAACCERRGRSLYGLLCDFYSSVREFARQRFFFADIRSESRSNNEL